MKPKERKRGRRKKREREEMDTSIHDCLLLNYVFELWRLMKICVFKFDMINYYR
jgi:hypothetical protein